MIKKNINNINSKHTSKTINPTQPLQDEIDKITFSILLHIKRTTKRIGRILNKYKSFLNSPKKIRRILRNPKDQRPSAQFRRDIQNILFL